MSAPTPRNPKGAGRKPSPDPNKEMQSFWCDADIAKELKNWGKYGFKTKAAMLNFALRNFIETVSGATFVQSPADQQLII